MGALVPGSDISTLVLAESTAFLAEFWPVLALVAGVGLFAFFMVALRPLWRG